MSWKAIALVAGLLLGWVGPARTAEIDSLTRRDEELGNAKNRLEQSLNEALERGVAWANEADEVCDERMLYTELKRSFARPFVGHVIAETLNEDDGLDSRRVRREVSIYRDLGLLDNISVQLKGLSAVVRVDDTLMGVDKLGHFVVEGWDYFDTAYLDEDGLDEAMTWGEETEESYFGHYTTGVRSYADLVANFEGMRFWRRVRGQGSDPVDDGWRLNRSYVRCGRAFLFFGERRWRVARKLDLDDYVTGVWDEANNCSSYRNEEIEALVDERVAELSEAAGVDLTCPVEPAACVEARERYGELAPRLLHPACLGAEPPRSGWWPFW